MFNRPTTFPSFGALAALLLFSITNGIASAEKIYKSIDKEGNVTYSTTPPPDAVGSEEIERPAGPTDEQVREAEERSRQTTELAGELERDRVQREKEQAQREADERARNAVPVAPVYVPVPVPYPYYDHPLVQYPPARPARPSGGGRPTPRTSR